MFGIANREVTEQDADTRGAMCHGVVLLESREDILASIQLLSSLAFRAEIEVLEESSSYHCYVLLVWLGPGAIDPSSPGMPGAVEPERLDRLQSFQRLDPQPRPGHAQPLPLRTGNLSWLRPPSQGVAMSWDADPQSSLPVRNVADPKHDYRGLHEQDVNGSQLHGQRAGGYAHVYIAIGRRSNALVAIKRQPLPPESPGKAQTATRELLWFCLLRPVPHPNILPMLDAFTNKTKSGVTHLYMVFPWMDQDLSRLARSRRYVFLPEEAETIFTGIASGLEHLHSLEIVHGDLSRKNVLVQGALPHMVCKLADMGHSFSAGSMMGSPPKPGEKACTISARSPEEMLGAVLSASSDLWALGTHAFLLSSGTGDLFWQRDEYERMKAKVEGRCKKDR